ncbi:cilia- and flagella-associated protein 54-like [Syngnathus typhle]|uniref:cilia- and flagella-associated protein 54-like n=1 Tax=Syngnathus typhle TaxID=161592 RepID=UPI002A6B2123|nr:cilia- and flagella-associated protein 54-like [Syngnathus typhle]XP_061154555.1 cilia- and flagella-associated protein 54-like [Syngnathus typhle]
MFVNTRHALCSQYYTELYLHKCNCDSKSVKIPTSFNASLCFIWRRRYHGDTPSPHACWWVKTIIMASMNLPATYYGKIDKRNPVIVSFERDINSFMTLMKRVSSTCQDNVSYAKGIKLLAEIWQNFKPRLPFKLYQDHMLRIGDFLTGLKLYQAALSQGYSLHLLQFCSISITNIKSVDHFIKCFFPGGFDPDQDILIMKVRSMLGCAQCIFELEKRPMVLSQKGLSKLLHVLNFIRIMMQAFQRNKHFSWITYNGTLHIFKMCTYLMSLNHSAKAMEHILWASLTLESNMPLMTIKHLPWLVKLYCTVCYCYYDSRASLQAEEFARRALGKINELAEQEKDKENDSAANKETQMAFREASIKLATMMFKRAVFETRRKPKHMITIKSKTTPKDFPNIPWPRNATERMLMGLFDSSAAQFLGICEALWDSSMRPLQARLPEELELQEVVLELLASGISILSGVATTTEQKRQDQSCAPLSALSTTSTLMELAVAGEHKVPVTTAVRFIKLMIQAKQPDVFVEHSRMMLEILSVVEGPAFRKAEYELALINGFITLKTSHRRRHREDVAGSRNKLRGSLDIIIGLTETLHKAVCESVPEAQPDVELVWDVLLFLWGKLKLVIQMDQIRNPEYTQDHDKWAWCLIMQCEVAFACDLATVDCIKTAEMINSLVLLLESAADRTEQVPPKVKAGSEKKYCFTLLKGSRKELLQKVCMVVEKGFKALVKRVVTLMPQDGAAPLDITYLLREDGKGETELSEKQKEEIVSDLRKEWSRPSTHTCMLAVDILLELDIIYHRASLKLMQLNAVTESDLLDKIKKNKVSKALFLIQKSLRLYDGKKSNESSVTRSLLEEACVLIEKAAIEERKLYIANSPKLALENKGKVMKDEKEIPPPRPVLISRTNSSLTFAPAPYHMEKQVCWYQLCGRAAEGLDLKVRLGDCSLAGTGNLVPAVCGEWQLKAERLEPNQKYVFALAAYTSQGKLLGNAIGASTYTLMTSMPQSLLSSWAHVAKVAFQTKQFDIAKKACKELWSHFTLPDIGPDKSQHRLTSTALHMKHLQWSSPLLCQLFLTSIFIETDINIQQQSLLCDSGSICGLFVWKQEVRLAECERLLVAMDLAMWLNDSSSAVQAVISCYGLLVPFIFHQITCDPAVKLLTKCLNVLKDNEGHLKQKWSRNTVETLMQMIGCITNYLTKALHALNEHQKASVVKDRGLALLQDVFDAQERFIGLTYKRLSSKIEDPGVLKKEMKKSVQLKALFQKFKDVITADTDPDTVIESSPSLNGSEDTATLRERILTSTLQHGYRVVMQLGSHSNFVEIFSLLLQRALEEGEIDLVLQWGETIFRFLSRRDDEMIKSAKCSDRNNSCEKESETTATESQTSQKTSKTPIKKRKKFRRGALLTARTVRELKAVERLMSSMNVLVQRHTRRLQLRMRCTEERVWRSQINYTIAMAHLALFKQDLDPFHERSLQSRYSHLNASIFFLANSGVLLKRNSEEQETTICEVSSETDSSQSELSDNGSGKDADKNETSFDSVESCEEVEELPHELEVPKTMPMDSLEKVSFYIRRAMTLAHRGGHWTSLLKVCHTVWEEFNRLTALQETICHFQPPALVTSHELRNTFTPLLVLATDLIMDMLSRLGLWHLYDSVTEEEQEFHLRFSAPLDDCTQVDIRFVCSLVLRTLELLHDCGKWEHLAHFALIFNSYTRERFALTVTPLLVLAQRKLLERIHANGGCRVPQPHHVKTQWATGKEVTYKSYAGCQLFSGWVRQSANQSSSSVKFADNEETELIDAEIRRSQDLVCVPLDVANTLHFYRQAIERVPHCLQVFRYSRSLLLLLLAHTQPGVETEQCCEDTEDVIDFNPILITTPNIQPWDLINKGHITPDTLYNLPVSPKYLSRIISTYSAATEYLQTNHQKSLSVFALHEMGNLHFYDSNTRMAHSCWSKAVDAALHSSAVIDKWDWVSFGGGTQQHTLRQAGLWGCLQAAVITAKIAQYILTSDITQRTKCCLLSAHLFKCVLCCSLAHPLNDLQYASHSIGDALLPGVDLFSEPNRADLAATVGGLNFICQWLFIAGYYLTLLPMLALYQHLVGTLCRDVQRNVESRILKVRALTELYFFSEAIKQTEELSRGAGILLPNGRYIVRESLQQSKKMFLNNKSLLDNVQALEELVSCELSPEVSMLYGSTLSLRFNLARVQLILALSSTVTGPPEPVTDSQVDPEEPEEVQSDTEDSEQQKEKPKGLASLQNLTRAKIKYLLLEAAAHLLESILEKLPCPSYSEIENMELKLEANLLKANLYLQQGHIAQSSDVVVSSLVLLQDIKECIPDHKKPSSDHPPTEIEQRTEPTTQYEDCPSAVEASERVGGGLWLRFRVVLLRCVLLQAADVTVPNPGKLHEKAAQVLKQSLEDCVLLGDVDTQALLLVEGSQLKSRRNRGDDGLLLLQEAVSLLSGRTRMPPGSSVTLIRATLRLSILKSTQSKLLALTQKLLQKQLCEFGENVILEDGKVCISPPGPKNIYLPYIQMLDQQT